MARGFLGPGGASVEPKPSELGAARLHSRRVAVRTVGPADLPFLYAVATDPAVAYRWRYRGATPSPEQFAAELWQGVLCQYVVAHREGGAPVGLVSAYQADLANRTCYVALLGDKAHDASGLMLEGALLFVSYLFHTWDFRQLYAEVPGYTLDSFGSGMGRYFREEGRLVDHSFHAGRWWDLHILAIHRSDWEKKAEPLLDALGATEVTD
jgi:RimJ/RimL family protein N-acetyltransferase